MTRDRVAAAVAALMMGLVGSGTARADVAADMLAELQAAGVPGAQVSVATPPPATAADLAAFDTNPDAFGPSMSDDNLISPDPTNPLPIARVSWGSTAATRYPGYIAPPDEGGWPAIQDASDPVYRLAVMTALRHALARGAILAGVSMKPSFPNRTRTTPDYWARRPDPVVFPPKTLTATLPVAAVEAAVKSGLPTLNATAQVLVSNWPAGERRLDVTVAVSALDYKLRELPDLAAYLLDKQLELNAQGAGIGAVVLRATDVLTNVPLSTFAADTTSGQQFGWLAPTVQAFAAPAAAAHDVEGDAQQAVNGLLAQEPE